MTEVDGDRKLADLSEVYELLKTDASDLLRDLLRGVSMWKVTALLALLLTFSWIALATVITLFGHPYGSPPTILWALYVSLALAVVSAILSFYLFYRYYTLRRKYTRLFNIAEKLR
jgi:ABC-type antimicrobial peptide transport system permease subunit